MLISSKKIIFHTMKTSKKTSVTNLCGVSILLWLIWIKFVLHFISNLPQNHDVFKRNSLNMCAPKKYIKRSLYLLIQFSTFCNYLRMQWVVSMSFWLYGSYLVIQNQLHLASNFL